MKYLKTFEQNNKTLIDYVLDNNIKKVKELIKSGVDVNMRDADDYTALILASDKDNDKDNIEISKFLIDSGADINAKARDGYTALILATLNQHIKIAKFLIDSGADINMKTNKNNTALMFAANATFKIDNVGLCKMLIDAGADWNIKNDVDGQDFLYFLNYRDKDMIINLYPDKYKNYLIKKEAEKYNI